MMLNRPKGRKKVDRVPFSAADPKGIYFLRPSWLWIASISGSPIHLVSVSWELYLTWSLV